MTTIRATMAQALVRYLAAQQVERGGETQQFFARTRTEDGSYIPRFSSQEVRPEV